MNKVKSYYLYLLIFLGILFCPNLTQAQFTLEGTVTDANTGEPLVGANIYNEATERGTSTDVDGKFSIELPDNNAEIRISFVGYISKTIEVSASDSDLSISLQADVANLEELVVTGLASSVKRENLANAVTKVSADELTGTVSPPTMGDALSGKIPGVNIRSTSGAPGGGFNVQLRGISTLGAGSSQPLYIIDGVYVNNASISSGRSEVSGAGGSSQDDSANRLADLNPEDVESIEVLKGPSAAAIYGQRANAGVVIITTKRGTAGLTEVGISQETGFVSPRKLLGYSSWNEDQIEYFYSGDVYESELQKYRQARAEGQIYDYEEMLYDHQGLISNTDISISGGNSDTQFFVSGSYHSEEGIMNNTGFNRGTVRANIDHNITEQIHISSSSNFINSKNRRGFTGNQNGTGASVGYALSYTPAYAQLLPDEEGNYPVNPYFADNPFAIVEHAENNQIVNRFIQSVSLDADLHASESSRLAINLSGGFDFLNANSRVFLPEFLQNQQAKSNPGDVIRSKEDNLNTNLTASLVYNQEISDVSFTSQVGFSRYDKSLNRQQIRGQGLVPGQDNVKQAQVQSVPIQAEERVTEIGFFGQEEVNWDDKLIGTLGLRLDRSTLNYDQDEYYLFPKASLAANLTNFDFFEAEKINQFKLRVAYGETGGVPNFGDTFRALNGSNIGNYLGLTVSNRDIDPDLKPETAQELEFGTDLSFFNNRISFSATYYYKTVEDLILDLPTASSTGVTAIATNAANLENKGIELGLNVSPFQSSSFSWDTNILFWKNDSKITDLSIPPFTTGGFGVGLGNYLIQEGFSPTTIVGVPATPDQQALYTRYGNAQPDFQLSFGNQFSFLENFQFNFLLHWSKGNDNVNIWLLDSDEGGTTGDWNNDDDGDGTPNGEERLSTFIPESYVKNASYLKLREIGLKYNFPATFINKTLSSSISQITIGLSANNIWMWTPYYGYDPENSFVGTQAVEQSVTIAPYPSSRKILFSLNVEL